VVDVRRRTSLVVVVGVLVAAALGWGIAEATVPSANGTFYACAAKSTGALRVLSNYPTRTCKSTETLLSWQRLSWRGAWTAKKAYASGALVSRSGSTWIALTSSTGHTPASGSAYWALFAAKGSTGTPGPKGATGSPGPSGAPGKDGTDGTDGTATAGSTLLEYGSVVNLTGIGTVGSDDFTTLHSWTLPQGSYVVTAEWDVASTNKTADFVHCTLRKGNATSTTRIGVAATSIPAATTKPYGNLAVTGGFTGTQVTLTCSSTVDTNVYDLSFTATKVSPLSTLS
jgi:hypothetical protein